ncbi:MAG: hypothetical protein IK045_01055 [Bacteroidales bacterium]|nr:hypothetical protein [Bacteroidales bacterium]
MTIDEYINQNLPFYHIASMNNLNAILSYGLKGRRGKIFVVRSTDHRVWNEIICQMNTDGDDSFAIIKLTPLKHHINADMVQWDNVNERTANLQNCIISDNIKVDNQDIITKHYHPDPNIYIDNGESFEALDEYHIKPRFDNSILVD